jgi:hypothetical protein
MKNTNYYLTLCLCLITLISMAQEQKAEILQVGDTSNEINTSAALEVNALDKGVLFPRVLLTSTTSSAPLSAHIAGMKIYNTTTIADVTPGMYFNDGTKWLKYASDDSTKDGDAWGVSGEDTLSVISRTGSVGIGTDTPTEKLHVIGNILAQGTITPDYVFQHYYEGTSNLKEDYKMPSLQEIEAFTKANKHLPGVPSAKEVKDNGGIIINKQSEILLEKIEELFLHTIEQQKQIENQHKEIIALKSLVNKLINK